MTHVVPISDGLRKTYTIDDLLAIHQKTFLPRVRRVVTRDWILRVALKGFKKAASQTRQEGSIETLQQAAGCCNSWRFAIACWARCPAGAMNGVAHLRLGYRIEDGFVPCGVTVNNSDLWLTVISMCHIREASNKVGLLHSVTMSLQLGWPSQTRNWLFCVERIWKDGPMDLFRERITEKIRKVSCFNRHWNLAGASTAAGHSLPLSCRQKVGSRFLNRCLNIGHVLSEQSYIG